MADKSFALKVELQGDVEKFKKNMDAAKAKTQQFSKGVAKSGATANKGFKNMSGNVNTLTGSMSGLAGGQGIGLVATALTSLASPAGIAAAAIGAVVLVIKKGKEQMEAFSETVSAAMAGTGQTQTARDTLKDEREATKGAIKAIGDEQQLMYRDSNLLRNKLRKAQRKDNKEEIAEIEATLASYKKRANFLSTEQIRYIQRLKDLRKLSDRPADILELNSLLAAKNKIEIQSLEMKEEMSRIDTQLRDNQVELANAATTEAEKKELIADSNKLIARYEHLNNTLSEERRRIALAIQALTFNTKEDSEELLKIQKEQTKGQKKMATYVTDINAKTGQRVIHEKMVTEELIKQEKIKKGDISGIKSAYVPPTGGDTTKITGAGAGITSQYSMAMENFALDMEAMTLELDMMIDDFLSGSISQLADGIGTALGSGQWDGLMKSLLVSFGGFFKQIGSMFISYGIANSAFIAALKNPTNPASPAVLIGAGAALVAIGGAITGAASSFAGGGSSSAGGGYAPAASQSSTDNTVRFVIEGDKLVGAIDNTNRKSTNHR